MHRTYPGHRACSRLSFRKFETWALAAGLTLVGICPLQADTAPRDLHASLALLPGLAETPDRGTFVELVKAMDDIYPGQIRIQVVPYARSFRSVVAGLVDFHIPAMRNPQIPPDRLEYQYVREKIGTMTMVLYSHRAHALSRSDIEAALAKGGPFPYVIEVSAGAGFNCPFPTHPSNNFEQSIRKLASGRIDAIWNAQEETDLILKRLRLKDIQRSFWGDFDDVIAIRKGPNGDAMNSLLSDLLKRLRTTGRLDAIYRKIHAPYIDWQPTDMDW